MSPPSDNITRAKDDQISPSAGRMGRPTDPRKEAAILEAARKSFLELSFDRVSMDAVAARAGVSKVTIYAKYKSKEALFVAAMNEGCASIYNQAKSDARSGGSIAEILTRLGISFMSMILAPEVSAMHGVMMQVAQDKPELPRQFYHSVVAVSLETLAETLTIAIERGELTCPDPRRAAIQFIAMIQGVYRYQLELGVEVSLNETALQAYVSDCVAVFLRGYGV
jgi:TetR/AcrR family transcriptional regulator, mexJK operon transcriptional repressor